MLDMYYLYSNQKSKMTKYKTFQSFGEFKTWADNLNDRELMIKILIVEKYQKVSDVNCTNILLKNTGVGIHFPKFSFPL